MALTYNSSRFWVAQKPDFQGRYPFLYEVYWTNIAATAETWQPIMQWGSIIGHAPKEAEKCRYATIQHTYLKPISTSVGRATYNYCIPPITPDASSQLLADGVEFLQSSAGQFTDGSWGVTSIMEIESFRDVTVDLNVSVILTFYLDGWAINDDFAISVIGYLW